MRLVWCTNLLTIVRTIAETRFMTTLDAPIETVRTE
jgi:hypothetical protein